MSQYQARTGPIQNDTATFSPEMVQGSMPSRNRATMGARILQTPLVQVTTFAFESVLGSQVDNRSRLTWPKQFKNTEQPTHTTAAFSPEMAAGTQGQTYPSPRIMLGPKIPLPIAQTTHVSAALSQDMVAGVTAPSPRILRPRQLNLPDNVFIQAFAFESVLALCLDSRNHLTKPQHLPALSQTTHVSAAFSMEMIQGARPPENKRKGPVQLRIGDLVFIGAFPFDSVLASQVDSRARIKPTQQHRAPDLIFIAPFSFESVLASRIDNKSRIVYPRQFMEFNPSTIHTAAPISLEMFAGAYGVVNRAKLGPRIPLPFSQTTQVAAPFSIEMIAGQRPLSFRRYLGPRLNIPDLLQIPPFSFESVLGSRLEIQRGLLRPEGSRLQTTSGIEAAMLIALVLPSIEGLEFTALVNRLHFLAESGQIDFSAILNRIHFTDRDEDL